MKLPALSKELRGTLLLICGTVGMSGIPVLAQLTMRHVSAVHFPGLWMAFSSFWAFVLILFQRPRMLVKRLEGLGFPFLLLGIFSCIWVQTYFSGVALLDAALATFLANSRIIWGVILGYFVFKERPGGFHLIAIVLAMIGIALILCENFSLDNNPRGILLVLVSAVFFVLVSAIVKKSIPRDAISIALFIRFFMPAIVLSIIGFYREPAISINASGLFWLAAGSFIGPFLSFFLIFSGLQMVKLGIQQIIQSLGLIFTAIISFFVFRTFPSSIQNIGGALILAAVLISNKSIQEKLRRRNNGSKLIK